MRVRASRVVGPSRAVQAKKDDVPKLAAKADNGKKFADLLNQLVGAFLSSFRAVLDTHGAALRVNTFFTRATPHAQASTRRRSNK